MAQRDDSKAAINFLDDKTVLLSLDEVTAARLSDEEEIDQDDPDLQDLRDSFVLALRQLTDTKVH